MKEALRGLINILKNHYWIIILAFLLTILIFAPLLAFPGVIGNKYQGININHFGSDAHFYLSRAKEVLDGHALGSPMLREGKNEADMYLGYSDYILLAPIKLFGLAEKVNVVILYNIYNFIGVFFVIILIYLLVLQLSGNKLLSMAAALFVIGGHSVIFYKTLFYHDFNLYARVIFPFISSLILFSYLNLLVKSFKSDELRRKIFAAMAFGLMFYIYFFAWSFTLALNAALYLIFIFKKDFTSARKVLFIGFVGLIIGSYNLIRLFSSVSSEIGEQLLYFNQLAYGHGLIFNKILSIALVLFFIFLYKCKVDKNTPLIIAIMLSGWISLNQQIITGRMLEYGHYYWYFIIPLSIIIIFYMIWQLISNKIIKKYFFIFIIVFVFLNTVVGQYKSFPKTLAIKEYEQNFRPIIDSLNSDKAPGVVLAADETDEYLFTIYTSHDLFWHGAASFNRVPIQRFEDALFVNLYLNKEARNDFKGYLIRIGGNKAEWSYYQRLYRNLEGFWSGLTYYEYNDRIKKDDQELSRNRPAVIDKLYKDYSEMVLKDNGPYKLLEKYGVNYIVWDKNEHPEWDLSFFGDKIKEIVSINNIYLYQIFNN